MDLTVGLAGSGADRIIVGTAEDEINQALAEVGAAGGGSVTLLQGTYDLNAGILIDRDNVTFKGAGAGQSVLRALPTYPVATPLVQAFAVDNFAIQDLTVDGHTNDAEANPIMAYDCTNGVIAGCEVLLSENHAYGIWLVHSDDIQVLNNRVDGVTPTNGQEGIETYSSDNLLISGNTVVNIGNAAINVGSTLDANDTNIEVVNNVVDNAFFGISIGVVGPRSFGQIEVEGNTLSNIFFGVRLYTEDQATGAPDSESATVDHPQTLHDIDISNNQIDLIASPYSIGIFLQNDTTPGAVSFSNIGASDNVFSNAAQAIGALGFAQLILADIAQYAVGSAYNDAIIGSDLANVFDGGGGADAMWGGSGDDTYYVDRADDFVFENVDEGTDTVFATSNYTLSANVEMLSLAYGIGIQAAGNAGNNWIWGNGLNNLLVGGGGTDAMAGGLGDDTYYVDSADDVVSENANEGTDTVFATSSYTLSANVEMLSLANGTGIQATGNAATNWIWGNGLDNVIVGGGGTDAMAGGFGDDTYYVDSADDLVGENANEGNDTVFATSSYTLSANVERLSLANGSGIQATGNAGNNWIWGNGLNNVLDGGAGTDTVDYSSATQAVVVDLPSHTALGAQIGTDTLSSIENVKTGSGNDAVAGDGATNVLDGGAGIDTVSYYAVSSGVVLDLAGQTGVDGTSTDTLLNFENANGTAYNDAISGTAAANVLNGLGGIDTISYYLSPQAAVIDLAGNVARQGGITDTIFNFENANATNQNDVVSGNAAANVLNGLSGTDTISYYASTRAVTIDFSAGTGVSGGVTDTLLNFENANGSVYADSITGNGGVNLLNGLGGADTLTGGGGFDTFELWAGLSNGDVITDFTGNGAAAGDAIKLVGFGTAAQGATFTQLNATQWQIHSGLDGHNETLTLSNGTAVHGGDFFFV